MAARWHLAKAISSCKIVLSWYVDSLECRLRNYAKKLIFKGLSVRSCHFDGISAFDQFISEIWFSNFKLCLIHRRKLHRPAATSADRRF